jgi:TatD DNase family protein
MCPSDKNSKKEKEVVRELPLDCFILETDCPYLAPVPFRGKDNTPGMVPLVIKRLAEERSMTFEEMAELTTVNGMRFYNIGER